MAAPPNFSLNDLQFTTYLSGYDEKNKITVAYDIEQAGTFTLSGRNLVASADSWASNGKIISVEDLFGTQMIVRPWNHSAPIKPPGPAPVLFPNLVPLPNAGRVPVVFKPKLVHFRIADREIYLAEKDFTPVTAGDGVRAFAYEFPRNNEQINELRQPKAVSKP